MLLAQGPAAMHFFYQDTRDTGNNKTASGAGEVARHLRALDACPKDPGAIPSTHKSHNHLELQFQVDLMLSSDLHGHQVHKWPTDKPSLHLKNKNR